MSVSTNPDRIYVNRQHRAKLRLDADGTRPSAALPGLGAALVNISAGGCCLRLIRSELPDGFAPGCYLPSLKLLHPELDSTPIEGRIAWLREEPPHMMVGIEFEHVRAITMASIRAYLGVNRSEQAGGASVSPP
jgi:hypothetical protein